MSNKKICFICCGAGNSNLVTKQALLAAQKCDELFTTGSYPENFDNYKGVIVELTKEQLPDAIIKSKSSKIGVLISGDADFYSEYETFENIVSSYADCEFIAGIDGFLYLAAKSGVSFAGVKTLYFEEGDGLSLLGPVSYNDKVFLKCDSPSRLMEACRELVTQGLGNVNIFAAENLSMKNEKIITGKASDIVDKLDKVFMMMVFNENFVFHDVYCFDYEFGKCEYMTREEIRWMALAMLNLQKRDIIFDIGAGSGSMALEMGRKACEGVVYAIDNSSDAIAAVQRNREHLGGFNVIPLCKSAMPAVTHLPVPDKVYIEGCSDLENVISYLFQINPMVKIIVTVCGLDRLTSAIGILKSKDIDYGVKSVGLLNLKKSDERRFAGEQRYFIINF